MGQGSNEGSAHAVSITHEEMRKNGRKLTVAEHQEIAKDHEYKDEEWFQSVCRLVEDDLAEAWEYDGHIYYVRGVH